MIAVIIGTIIYVSGLWLSFVTCGFLFMASSTKISNPKLFLIAALWPVSVPWLVWRIVRNERI